VRRKRNERVAAIVRKRGGEDEDGERASGNAHQRLNWLEDEPSVGKTSASKQNIYICPAGKILEKAPR